MDRGARLHRDGAVDAMGMEPIDEARPSVKLELGLSVSALASNVVNAVDTGECFAHVPV